MGDNFVLNVGGKIYHTSRSTLTRYPDSFFDGLVNGSVQSAKDDQGNYLIDQDGKIFRHVLNFLRYGKLVLPEEFNDFHLLELEADFFSIGALKKALKDLNRVDDNVGLNVGGRIYRTSRVTLTRYPDSFFSRLLDGDLPSDKDDQGNYLIDQDGEIFCHVLNFLRYGEPVLPEGFSGFRLLERQADFFLLQALKESIEIPVSIGGSIGLMFDDGKLFNTTKETLSKEDSFFTKMLRGEVAVSRDSQGNYVMGRDGSVFDHILSYLRDGGICNAITSDELASLEKDAEYFELKLFAAHIQSIRYMQSHTSALHLYFPLNSPCVAYAYSSRPTGPIPYLQPILPQSITNQIDKLLSHRFTIDDYVQSGVVNMDKINPNGPASDQVMAYFKGSFQPDKTTQSQLPNSNNCTILKFIM